MTPESIIIALLAAWGLFYRFLSHKASKEVYRLKQQGFEQELGRVDKDLEAIEAKTKKDEEGL